MKITNVVSEIFDNLELQNAKTSNNFVYSCFKDPIQLQKKT